MHRCAKHDAVCFERLRQQLIHHILLYTFAKLFACATAQTAADGLIAKVEHFCFHALGAQCFLDFLQCRIGTAVPIGAAVHQKYLHIFSSCSLLQFTLFKNFSLFTKRMMQAFAPSLFVSLILLPDKHSAL